MSDVLAPNLTPTQCSMLGIDSGTMYREYDRANDEYRFALNFILDGGAYQTALSIPGHEMTSEEDGAEQMRAAIEKTLGEKGYRRKKKFNVRVEYIPEASFDGVEWGWEAEISQAEIFSPKAYSIDSKFGYASIAEARENMEAVLEGFLPALSEDRVETFTREI